MHPVAPPLQEKKRRKNGWLLTQKTVSGREGEREGEMQGYKKRNEGRIIQVKRFKGQEHREYEDIKKCRDDEVRMERQIGGSSRCFIFREKFSPWHEDNLCLSDYG